MRHFTIPLAILFFVLISGNLKAGKEKEKKDSLLTSQTFSGLKFRSIGPAFKSGRIADIAVHPDNRNIWYVAVGSGGVWKTENSGTTWTPVFEHQPVYSIGCVTIDPNNPHTVWVGTGENVGGRHVGFGDGIYKSDDDGHTWENMGLKETQHISKIIVHPSNPDIIWVAAQGPLWNKGGERGLYKSTDGGKTWKKTLGDDEWTGVTDIVCDPRNPDRMYAATWQRHRNVACYLGGGPGTAVYRSEDGGETWEKLTNGLPSSDMGKIGLAVSPQKPDVVYAAIELDRRTGGVFRSDNRGASWVKMSQAVSGATGPHYYQELYASPHQFDRIYLVDVRIQISDDGGKTFRRMKEEYKHSDNHVIVFRDDDPGYLLVGTDGGLYESYDGAKSWRFIRNLPVTQFYKVAVDDAKPIYHIYGGTQDNGTQGGLSRTLKYYGITTDDWDIIMGADGHQPATEPGNPDIVYAETQEGYLTRIDMTTGERMIIQPQPGEGEPYERYNWDAPVLISPHSPTRIYFASQRVWRSDDRGDTWRPVSGDLTKNQERLSLPIMGKTWSWDAAWDVNAMSNYNTVTSLAESPLQEGLIYAGTDDGSINVTEDGGKTWRTIAVDKLPGVPATAFVNDIKTDLFDANTVYVALDNHKFGDLSPYLFKSTDKGKSWKSLRSNLPDKTIVWRMVQDHVKPGLLFLGTEFGIYFTVNGGKQWIKLTGGLPTIPFRDLVIQRDANDLVCASFGRGFYVLDDYSILREVTEEVLQKESALFSVRDAWWYIQQLGKGKLGGNDFLAPNPPFGAVFTYYLKEGYKTKRQLRQEKEKELIKNNENVTFPGWDTVETERRQEAPMIWLTVMDEHNNTIRKINGPVNKGLHRIAWDLSYPVDMAINACDGKNHSWGMTPMVAPGNYKVALSKEIDGTVTPMGDTVMFKVIQLQKGALKGASPGETVAFWKQLRKLQSDLSATSLELDKALKKADAMKTALSRAEAPPGETDKKIHDLKQELLTLDEHLTGNRSKDEIGEKNNPTIRSRMIAVRENVSSSTYGPTPSCRKNMDIALKELNALNTSLQVITGEKIPQLEKELEAMGAPPIK